MSRYIFTKRGDGRYSPINEDALAPRYTALVMIVLLLAYGIVGALE